jgi:hypothetical protein
MAVLPSYQSALQLLSRLTGLCLALCCFVSGQIPNQDTQIEVHDLPSLTARSPHSSDVLLTSLETVFHDREVCCGKDSALEDSVAAANPKSLKDVADKLGGRHLLSDGRPINVTTEYLTPDQVSAGHLIVMTSNQHAPLMEWNSHVYVVHGIVYLWAVSPDPASNGLEQSVIHKFLLWDTRYADSRREVVFDRTIDAADKIQGLLFVDAKLQ